MDTDVDGNGVEELLIGGYKNTEWNNANDVGKLDSGKNLIQMLCWNKESQKYEEVWNAPKEVEAHSDLKTDTGMMEPAALTAGTLHKNSNTDQVFLEGTVFQFVGNTTGTTEKERLQNGSFSKELSMKLDGSHSAFISTAYAAKFSFAGGTVEQIVVISGDHQATDNDQIYYDIGWIWESNTTLTSAVTNNNYINRREEDDEGTFLSMCPLDVDEDAMYVEYTGKTYGWSNPVLYSVLQSPPYWSELKYNSETFGDGWRRIIRHRSRSRNRIRAFAMYSYLGSYATEHSTSDSYEITVAPGEDQAIIMAVPMISYHYNLWVPTYTVTQEDIDNYNELRRQDPEKEPYPYPHSQAELCAPGNVKNLHLSKYPANVQVGEGVSKIAYEMESGTAETHGFQLSFSREVYSKIVAKTSIFVESEFEAETGFQFALDGGASWISTNSKGLEFSAAFSDLPSGTGDAYRYSSYLAVFKADGLPMGGGNSDGVYVVSYVVTGVDENNAPPMLPVDLRVFGTTEDAAILKWDASAYRPAKSYEIFIEDNHGMAVSVGKTDVDYFVATGLEPSSQYRFAMKSYSGEGQTGIASSMSRWLAVTTKGSSASNPYFTQFPKNVVVTPDGKEPHILTAAAQKGQGMESAALTYQWQQYSQDTLTKDGIWIDIPGAVQESYTLPEVTAANINGFAEQTHYRVVARQAKGSSVTSIISKTATMFVNNMGVMENIKQSL